MIRLVGPTKRACETDDIGPTGRNPLRCARLHLPNEDRLIQWFRKPTPPHRARQPDEFDGIPVWFSTGDAARSSGGIVDDPISPFPALDDEPMKTT